MEPLVADSARKHGNVDEDALHAFQHAIKAFSEDDGFVMLISRPAPGSFWRWGTYVVTWSS